MTEPPTDDNSLRKKLAEAPVVAIRPLPCTTRNAAAIVVVTLEGQVEAFWKRGDLDPPGVVGVRREVAAYELSLLLGWDELLQTVALRREVTESGEVAEIASIELLPEGKDDLHPNEFDRADVERAGVFDALIRNTDRSGHNWRGIASPNHGGYRLKLYDHELAFGVNQATSSSFWAQVGEAVPPDLRSALADVVPAVRESSSLRELLGDAEHVALVARLIELSES